MGNQDVTTHKFVAVLNRKIESGKVMNALAHMSLGLVAGASSEEIKEMRFIEYRDGDGTSHPYLSKNSYVILRADNSNQLRTLRQHALEAGVNVIDFTDTMQEGTYEEQLKRTKMMPETELEYYGVCLFGKIAEVGELTRKFQLWK